MGHKTIILVILLALISGKVITTVSAKQVHAIDKVAEHANVTQARQLANSVAQSGIADLQQWISNGNLDSARPAALPTYIDVINFNGMDNSVVNMVVERITPSVFSISAKANIKDADGTIFVGKTNVDYVHLEPYNVQDTWIVPSSDELRAKVVAPHPLNYAGCGPGSVHQWLALLTNNVQTAVPGQRTDRNIHIDARSPDSRPTPNSTPVGLWCTIPLPSGGTPTASESFHISPTTGRMNVIIPGKTRFRYIAEGPFWVNDTLIISHWRGAASAGYPPQIPTFHVEIIVHGNVRIDHGLFIEDTGSISIIATGNIEVYQGNSINPSLIPLDRRALNANLYAGGTITVNNGFTHNEASFVRWEGVSVDEALAHIKKRNGGDGGSYIRSWESETVEIYSHSV
jgi:hypothetical protein